MSKPDLERALPREAVAVRLASAADSVEISRVLLEAFSPHREHYTDDAFAAVTPSAEKIELRFAEGPIWIAEIDGKAVGTVSLTTEPDGLYIRSMAVTPSAQGRGIGHLLLDAIDEHIGEDAGRVFLYTTYFVAGAKELYEKHGFKWVRDTLAEEWYGTRGLEMDRNLDKRKLTT